MVRVLCLLAVLGVAVAGVLTFLNTEHVSSADMAARRQAAATRLNACVAGQDVREVDGRTIRGNLPPPGSPDRVEYCRFATGGADDPRFKLTTLKGILQG